MKLVQSSPDEARIMASACLFFRSIPIKTTPSFPPPFTFKENEENFTHPPVFRRQLGSISKGVGVNPFGMVFGWFEICRNVGG